MTWSTDWFPGGSCVYRAFDADGALLYIGSTVNFDARVASHRSISPWCTEVVRFERTGCPDLDYARVAEADAIRNEFPRWNITGRSRSHPDGPAHTHWAVAQLYPGTFREALISPPASTQFMEARNRAVDAAYDAWIAEAVS